MQHCAKLNQSMIPHISDYKFCTRGWFH